MDARAAADGYFGELIASGVHTLAVYQRLAVESHFARWRIIAGRRIHDLRFLVPVRAGDRLTGRPVVDSVDKDTRGRASLQIRGELTNQHGEAVLTLTMESLILMRPDTRSRRRGRHLSPRAPSAVAKPATGPGSGPP